MAAFEQAVRSLGQGADVVGRRETTVRPGAAHVAGAEAGLAVAADEQVNGHDHVAHAVVRILVQHHAPGRQQVDHTCRSISSDREVKLTSWQRCN